MGTLSSILTPSGVVTTTQAADYVTLNGSQTVTNKTLTAPSITGGQLNSVTLAGVSYFSGAFQETRIAIGASNIDLSLGNVFTRTISGATTLTVSNIPTSGKTCSFILDLTNGGSAAITWWSGVKWQLGAAPGLTAAGRDVLGFFTHDAGTTWTGLLLGKDVK